MTYGTPTASPELSAWRLVITDTTVSSYETLSIDFTAHGNGGGNTPADAEALFQKLVTAVSGDPDIGILLAERTYPSTQTVTP